MYNDSNNKTNYYGIGFVDLLTIVFVTLKLLNIINWSWWWVLSPLWISFILFILVMIVLVIIFKLLDR